MSRIAVLSLILACISCGHNPQPTAKPLADRLPNSSIRTKAREAAALHPASLTLSYCTTDRPRPPGRDGAQITLVSQAEIENALGALQTSDRSNGSTEPFGEAKDNMLEITFPEQRLWGTHFCVMISTIDEQWGKSVRALFQRYLPADMEVRKGQLMPKRRA